MQTVVCDDDVVVKEEEEELRREKDESERELMSCEVRLMLSECVFNVGVVVGRMMCF